MSVHLDYKNCKCRKKVAYSFVEECDENTDENKIIHSKTLSIKEYNKSTTKSTTFFNDITNIGDLDLSLLNVVSLEFKNNNSVVYDIKYIKNLNSSNSLYIVFNNLDTYIAKSVENKYLIFTSTYKNEMILEDYTEIWNEIKEQIKLISGNKVIKYSLLNKEIL